MLRAAQQRRFDWGMRLLAGSAVLVTLGWSWNHDPQVASSPASRRAEERIPTVPRLLPHYASAAESSDSDDEEKLETRAETPLIGDYTTFGGLNPLPIEGVGLVVGLNGTGGNPAPSPALSQLIEDLKKRDVRDIQLLLQSPSTSLVLIRAFLPPLVDKGETLDVEVVAPEESESKSIEGGWLMETLLSEQSYVPGRDVLKGNTYAKVQGPIVTKRVSTSNSDDSPELRRGRVLGGAVVHRERELSIYLRSDFANVRNSKRISDAIGRRFHDYQKAGIKRSLAEAKDDKRIILKVHPRYKDNFPRYLQVVRHIAFRETPVAERVRIQRLQRELLNPETSERAAYQLEAIGQDGVTTLRTGLKSPLMECRFHAATALAYMGEEDGLPVLIEAARQERAFRVYALAALSTFDNADAAIEMRKLMSESAPELRYGAFRALFVADKKDPFIRGEGLRRKENGPAEYWMHVLDCEGDPMVHVSLHRRPEIVLFGANQRLETPLMVTAGRNILISAQAGDSKATITRYRPGKPEERRECSLNIADVIREAAELEAHYPEVVQMLVEAERQHNLPGQLALDSLPTGGRFYERPKTSNGPISVPKARIGKPGLAPNLFFQDGGATHESTEGGSKSTGMADASASKSSGSNGMPKSDSPASDADPREATELKSPKKWWPFPAKTASEPKAPRQ